MRRVLFSAVALATLAGVSVAQESPLPPLRPIDRPSPFATPAPVDPYAADRQQYRSDEVRVNLPRLGDQFEIVGPSGKHANAFGDALGLSLWLNPPAIGASPNELAACDEMFARYGYQRQSGFDLRYEPGVQKIVVFAKVKVDGELEAITTAVRLESEGTWTTKCGGMAKIRIKDLNLLRGPVYGFPALVYVRKIS